MGIMKMKIRYEEGNQLKSLTFVTDGKLFILVFVHGKEQIWFVFLFHFN